MIILDFLLLCFLIYLLYCKDNDKTIIVKKKIKTIENLDLNNSDYKSDYNNDNNNDNKIYIKKI